MSTTANSSKPGEKSSKPSEHRQQGAGILRILLIRDIELPR
jgi:hypothetical protein